MSINWYDGVDNQPPRPKELSEKGRIPACGKFIYSDELTFQGGTHGAGLNIISKQKEDMAKKMPSIPKGETNHDHMKNFMLAAMGKEECNSKFAVSAPLTQVFMLGCIAQRLGGTLKFDAKTKQITNNARANQLLKGNPPRKGWEEYYTM